MLRITVNRSASGAKKYYSDDYYKEGQSKQNYYSEKDQSIGIWGGKGCEKLSLNGDIDKNDFASLCDNLIPGTDDKLTMRNNSERRVGYDFTFNVNKSVSLAYTFGSEKDRKELLQAFHESVSETMSEIETGMQSRVRIKGQNENRETSNITYGRFTHFTSRPINGIPDPHLHAHCFVFNSTYDEKEQKWKAGEFGQIKTDATYYEVVFHSTFAKKLQSLGYEIENAEKGFEIKGVTRDTIEKFSNRTEEIERIALENDITDEESKAKLGSRTRENKRESIPEEQQIENWNARLTDKEKLILENLRKEPVSNEDNYFIGKSAIDFSLSHHLERKSVATEKEILATAIKTSIGQTTPEYIKSAFAENRTVIAVKENHQTFITTQDALLEENNLIAKAYQTKGAFKPINECYVPKAQELNDQQLRAINSVLNTSDGISIISGKAGTGKTTLMKEVWSGVRESGKEIYAFAPSAEASRVVQRKEGFENAETLALLIQNKELQKKVKNSVIWIDEAGMISNKDMNKVLDIAKEQNARLILTGDINQHKSVERGDALRILQQEADIIPIQVSKIQRQKNANYKLAVASLSKGDIEKGFNKLEKIGAIHQIEDDKERIEKIVEDYYSSSFKGNSKRKIPKEVLVISPTHAEGDKVTESIRQKLKSEGVIAGVERNIVSFKNTQLTAAEKLKLENYQLNNWIIFHQNTKGFKAGAKYLIAGKTDEKVLVKDVAGNISFLDVNLSNIYNIYRAKEITLSKGDKIRISGNGKAMDGKHLFNGSIFNVKGFDRNGNIKLSNGSTLSKDYGHINLGYVMTSHASQGKTVDKVIISQSSMSLRAASKEQFYVSVSRGREGVSIYTDDKHDLLRAVSISDERKSALELTRAAIQNKVMDVNRTGTLNRVKAIARERNEKTISLNR